MVSVIASRSTTEADFLGLTLSCWYVCCSGFETLVSFSDDIGIYFFHLDEICQACIVLSPIKMVPRPNYGSYKGIQSKHRKTHKGIKDQKSDSSESPLGDIRQKKHERIRI